MNSYIKLALTIGVHFFIMYALTYVAVYTWSDIPLFSTRSLYMALVMVAPMIFIMVFAMRGMYGDKKLNLLLYAGSAAIFITSFFFIREQVFVGDMQFLQSMIPHHSSAITMCEKSSITDPEIIELCENIVTAQQEEIAQMKAIIERLENK